METLLSYIALGSFGAFVALMCFIGWCNYNIKKIKKQFPPPTKEAIEETWKRFDYFWSTDRRHINDFRN